VLDRDCCSVVAAPIAPLRFGSVPLCSALVLLPALSLVVVAVLPLVLSVVALSLGRAAVSLVAPSLARPSLVRRSVGRAALLLVVSLCVLVVLGG
jgi:hypothetical protein